VTAHEQLRRVCDWNCELVRANSHLREELVQVRQERDELSDTNVKLQVERDAADQLLGAAIDEALRARHV
jgi:hypothetical protein